jgi:hypothetical protein
MTVKRTTASSEFAVPDPLRQVRDLMTGMFRSWTSLLVVTAMISCGCSHPAPVANTPPAQATSGPTPRPGFESDLAYVRRGQFTYIYVFSRKDGGALQPDDGAFLRQQAPRVVDWVKTDDGRKVIAGSNFDIEPANMEALRKRFKVEDYSGK